VSDDERTFRASFADTTGLAGMLITPFMLAGLIYLLRTNDTYAFLYAFAPLLVLIPILRRATAVHISREGIRNRYGRLLTWATVHRIASWNAFGILVIRGKSFAVVLPSLARSNDFRECLRNRLNTESPVRQSPTDMSRLAKLYSFTSSAADLTWAAGSLLLMIALVSAGLFGAHAIYGTSRLDPFSVLPAPVFMGLSVIWTNRRALISEHGFTNGSTATMSWSEIKRARPVYFPFRGMLITDDRTSRIVVPRSVATDPVFRETVRSLAGEQNPLVLALH